MQSPMFGQSKTFGIFGAVFLEKKIFIVECGAKKSPLKTEDLTSIYL